MSFETLLLNYGPLGLWVAWLIWDRRTLIRSFESAIQANTTATISLSNHIQDLSAVRRKR